jgi:hypothetical protein
MEAITQSSLSKFDRAQSRPGDQEETFSHLAHCTGLEDVRKELHVTGKAYDDMEWMDQVELVAQFREKLRSKGTM